MAAAVWPRKSHLRPGVAHFSLRLVIVVDSLGSAQTEPTDARRATQLLTYELHRLGGKGVFDWTGWKVVSLGRLSPQQGADVVNCGVLLLAVFWALAAGVSLQAIRPADLPRWRERFLQWLLDGGESLVSRAQAAG